MIIHKSSDVIAIANIAYLSRLRLNSMVGQESFIHKQYLVDTFENKFVE
jgi:hypothetical protein